MSWKTTCKKVFSALLTRLLFFFHTLISVALAYTFKEKVNLWFLMLLLGVPLLIETIIVIYKRKGQEYMYFWPSCFMYLTAMLPVIWVMELDLLDHRLEQQDKLKYKLDVKVMGLDIKAVLDNNVSAKTVGELGLIVIIIIGRWLLPRGQLTRDQLSALLLGYIGTGADILDMFSSISNEKIAHNTTMHYVILTMFSWSMLQFCITATVSAGSEIMGPATSVDMESSLDVSDSHNGSTASSRQRWSIGACHSIRSSISNKLNKCCCCNCDADLLQIFVPVLMQDGPFLILRVFLWAKYGVNDGVHLYFTGKNALTLALLFYRLYCLKVKDHPEGGGSKAVDMCLENQADKETDKNHQEDKESGEESEGRVERLEVFV